MASCQLVAVYKIELLLQWSFMNLGKIFSTPYVKAFCFSSVSFFSMTSTEKHVLYSLQELRNNSLLNLIIVRNIWFKSLTNKNGWLKDCFVRILILQKHRPSINEEQLKKIFPALWAGLLLPVKSFQICFNWKRLHETSWSHST